MPPVPSSPLEAPAQPRDGRIMLQRQLANDFKTQAKDSHMEYKSIDFVTLFSGLLGAGSVLGAAALTFGPWAPAASDGPYALLVISGVAFGMLSRLAGNVSSVLTAQADQIADLRRQLKEQTSRG